MRVRGQTWWTIGKALLGLAIVAAIAGQFVRILQDAEVRRRLADAEPMWLAASALLYIGGLFCWAGFWFALLRVLGERPSGPLLLRAYFASHLGKYVPGKAWALVLRTTLGHAAGVRLAVAVLTSVYETLTTMAAGAALAIVLLGSEMLADQGATWRIVLLLLVVGIPLLPPVFNPLADRVTAIARRAAHRRQQQSGGEPLPRVRHIALVGGVLWTALGWWMLGLSLWAMLCAVTPEPVPWDWGSWTRYTGYVAFAYVAGFVIPMPGGLGVREVILAELLAAEWGSSEHDRDLAWGVAILLRLLWMAAEVIMAVLVFALTLAWKPPQPPARLPSTDDGPPTTDPPP